MYHSPCNPEHLTRPEQPTKYPDQHADDFPHPQDDLRELVMSKSKFPWILSLWGVTL
jgi:hypothetical protein